MSLSLDGGDMGSEATASLLSNPTEVLHPALKVMRLLLKNIVAHPDEDKYRSIKLKNRTMEKKLWPAAGAKEYMIHVLGFAEVSATLSYHSPTNRSLPLGALPCPALLLPALLGPALSDPTRPYSAPTCLPPCRTHLDECGWRRLAKVCRNECGGV